jgi:choline dehydrogenase-like flavoprotein
MGDSPKNAVVDPNARVFGLENLYMAGSSIFATGGHANPTLTIVQLTLRLAQHLNTS